MKQYTYSEDAMNTLFRYLATKPFAEVEQLVALLRSPAKVETVEDKPDGKEEVKKEV